MLIDTHVHLNHDDLTADFPGILERAEARGVGAFVVIGYDLASSGRAIELADSDPQVWAVVGVHPHDAARWDVEAEAHVRAWSAHPRVVAVGEIGLDFYTGSHGERTLAAAEVQRRAFEAQLEIAADAGLAVVIHCREAYDETLEILEAQASERTGVILHCFQGERRHAERAWARGWFLGIGGAVTFKNQEGLRDVVRAAPEESLLLETDAPYLSPAPLRGKYPNEPARVALVAEKVAELRGLEATRLAAVTTANAQRALRKLAPP